MVLFGFRLNQGSTFASNLSHHSTKHKNQSVTPAKSGNHVVKTVITKAKPTANDLRSTIKPTPSFVTAKTGCSIVISKANSSCLLKFGEAKPKYKSTYRSSGGAHLFLIGLQLNSHRKNPKFLRNLRGTSWLRIYFPIAKIQRRKTNKKRKEGGGAKKCFK